MIPVISSPTRSWYSSYIICRSASRIRCRITCLAVWAAIRPKSSGVTSRVVDLVLVRSDHLRVELRVLGLAHFAGLGVDLGLLLQLGGLGQQLLLQLRRQDQFEDAEVAGFVVEVDAGVFGGAGGLLVGREQGVLEGVHQLVGGDSLLLLERFDCVDDLFAHWCGSLDSEVVAGAAVLGARAWRPRASTRSSRSLEVLGDPFAERQVDPARVIDEDAQGLVAGSLDGDQVELGIELGKLLLGCSAGGRS